jgi:hypothetical protein
VPAPRLGDLEVSLVRDMGAPVTPYELMLRTIMRPDGMLVQIDFQRERFSGDAVADWLARYVAIVHRFLAAPDQRLSQL